MSSCLILYRSAKIKGYDFIIEHLLLDSFVTKRTEEVEQLSAMLASTTALVHQSLNDIDEAQCSAGDELVTNFNQLLEHCSQTKVCSPVTSRLLILKLKL